MLVHLPFQLGLWRHDRTQSPEKTLSDGETEHIQAPVIGLTEKK